jgi:hypothetical protein
VVFLAGPNDEWERALHFFFSPIQSNQMAKKNSDNGGKATVLLIREISPEALEVLEWYKRRTGVAANTTAALELIAGYQKLYDELEDLKGKFQRLDTNFKGVVYAIKEKLQADERLAKLVNHE